MRAARIVSAAGLLFCAACGGSAPSGPPDAATTPPTYEAVAAIVSAQCAFSSCHGGGGAGAGRLNLARAAADGTLRDILVDQPSCQYDAMPLVTAGDPERSWFFLKVAGAHTGNQLRFTPDSTWDPGLVRGPDGAFPASQCPLVVGGEIRFGAMMPQGTSGLAPEASETIRGWIAAGAPGPS